VVFVEQPEPARVAVKEAIKLIANSGQAAPFALAALHVMTTLTGSVLLALAAVHGAHTPAEAWTAAHIDEDFEMRAWGEDAEALRRRARQWRDMEAAARLFQAVQSRSMKEHAFSRSHGTTFPSVGNAIGKQEDGQ